MKVILTTVALLLSVAATMSADVAQPAARQAAPDFTLPTAQGKSVRLSALKGQVVLLDFWATWCAGCKVEIPWFMEFQRTYQSKGLSAVGVAMDEDGWRTITPYLKEHPINYAIVTGDPAIAEHYGVTALPITVLIDRAGRVAATHRGLVDKTTFEKDLRRLLEEGK